MPGVHKKRRLGSEAPSMMVSTLRTTICSSWADYRGYEDRVSGVYLEGDLIYLKPWKVEKYTRWRFISKIEILSKRR